MGKNEPPWGSPLGSSKLLNGPRSPLANGGFPEYSCECSRECLGEYSTFVRSLVHNTSSNHVNTSVNTIVSTLVLVAANARSNVCLICSDIVG